MKFKAFKYERRSECRDLILKSLEARIETESPAFVLVLYGVRSEKSTEVMSSVSRWVYYFFNIWPFTTRKFYQKHKIFVKVGSQFCQILNSYSRNGQKLFKILPEWLNYATSGHTGTDPSVSHSLTPEQRWRRTRWNNVFCCTMSSVTRLGDFLKLFKW